MRQEISVGWRFFGRCLASAALLLLAAGTSRAACGDGVVDVGEQCDDGNLVDYDFCSSTCRYELIPGSKGFDYKECFQEWMTEPIPTQSTDANRLTVSCQDDDPACDFGSPGDEACTFHVALCFNNTDPRILSCAPDAIDRVRLLYNARNPNLGNPIIDELLGLGGVVERGRCNAATNKYSQACTLDTDCDSGFNTFDGQCVISSIRFNPSLQDEGACTAFADFTIPLRMSSTGQALATTKYLGLSAQRFLNSTGSRKRSDRDVLKLTCMP